MLTLPQGNQWVGTNPRCGWMLCGEHCYQVERLRSHVDERVRYSSWDLRYVRRLHRHRFLTNPILGTALEQDVRFFGVMYMEPRPATRVRFGNDEGERLETVLIAIQAMSELAWNTVPMTKLVECEKEIRWTMWLHRRPCECLTGKTRC